MVAGGKTVVIGLSAVSMVSLLSGITYHFSPKFAAHDDSSNVMDSEEAGNAVAGRFVSIPAKLYNNTFKAGSLKLGQCPLVMLEGSIKTCKDEFEGDVVHLAKGKTTVDVSRVQSSEDILTHIMGGVGVSVGVLGLVSVNPKVKVAVTTDTNKKALNLMSSYEINKGMVTLYNPRPKHVEGDKALFLSEIELGGSELLLVTLEFESEEKKTEVEITVTVKILFISITAKLRHIFQTFTSSAKCRIQFKSSWRDDVDVSLDNMKLCINKTEEIENMYMKGPQALRDMDYDDERSHYFYYFSSWKASPYGSQFNLALINHDLEFLTEQNTEIKAVIERINNLKDKYPDEVKKQILQFNTTLTDMTLQITTGLNQYHTLKPDEREKLRDIYGQHKAPQYYKRYLDRLISSTSS